MNSNIVVGADIGGSHITAALIDLQTHAILPGSLTRRSVNAKADANKVIHEWATVILKCKTFYPVTSNRVGMAMPGPFDYENGISLIKGVDKYEQLFQLNVKELLANALGIVEEDIFMMNDASCFLKGELFGGAARDMRSVNVTGITLGTGLGSASFTDGVLHEGDLYCTPFKEGFAEDYLSARWFVQQYKIRTGIQCNNVKEICEQVPHDAIAASLFAAFGRHLAEVLIGYIETNKAGAVVIGGNIANAWDLFIPETKTLLQSQSVKTVLLKSLLGEESALLGAASLCI
ncbi:MAG: ROK family protein [Chitinophagaceae bacterium]